MTSPLNPSLYQRLREEFGQVSIAQQGVAASVTYNNGLLLSEPNLRMEMKTSGEYYKVNCPYCGDSRGRLWINHLWGVRDDITNRTNLWLAICYNEDCLKTIGRAAALYDRVYGFQNANLRGQKPVILPSDGTEQTLKPKQVPGKLIKLSDLQDNHPAITYLNERKFNIYELQDSYSVEYCECTFGRYTQAASRIFIPIIMESVLVGWQCRYPAELDWKASNTMKYYSCPNMPKRLMLYNFDNAIQFPFVVICEGPTDVWNTGLFSVAAFGKHPSFNQIKLLCNTWPELIIIMLDGDAWSDTVKLVERIQAEEYKGKIVPIKLPLNKDPGNLTQNELYDYIIRATTEKNIDLLDMRRNYSGIQAKQCEVVDISSAISRLDKQLVSK